LYVKKVLDRRPVCHNELLMVRTLPGGT